jgi:hypothetical protein
MNCVTPANFIVHSVKDFIELIPTISGHVGSGRDDSLLWSLGNELLLIVIFVI